MADFDISIHALLAESDACHNGQLPGIYHFYPRSPCGERLWVLRKVPILGIFLSTLSLRRATGGSGAGNWRLVIFLSTLSLRRATKPRALKSRRIVISIHALLAESDLDRPTPLASRTNFYPRSPCGERLKISFLFRLPKKFLSTLSLRRATLGRVEVVQRMWNFYPRSPCGERLESKLTYYSPSPISIHALLAESDFE